MRKTLENRLGKRFNLLLTLLILIITIIVFLYGVLPTDEQLDAIIYLIENGTE